MDRQGPPNRPRYQLTRGLTRIRHEKDAMTSRGKQEMKYDAPPGEYSKSHIISLLKVTNLKVRNFIKLFNNVKLNSVSLKWVFVLELFKKNGCCTFAQLYIS